MEFEYKTLEEKFKKLPVDIQRALTSTDVAADLEEIAKKNGLLLDQASTMVDLTSYVLLGLLSSKDFVSTLSKEAQIDTKTATAVAKDINEQIFGKIRTSIQKIQESKASDTDGSGNSDMAGIPDTQVRQDNAASIELAGGFSIDEAEADGDNEVAESDKEEILSGIENPQPSNESFTRKDRVSEEPHVEAIVDHMLSNPVAQPEVKVSQKMPSTAPTPSSSPQKAPTYSVPANLPTDGHAPKTEESMKPTQPVTPPAPKPQSRPKGPDPYREALN